MTLVQQNNDQAYNYLVVEVGNRAKFLWSSVTKMTGTTVHACVVIHLTIFHNLYGNYLIYISNSYHVGQFYVLYAFPVNTFSSKLMTTLSSIFTKLLTISLRRLLLYIN